MKYPTLTRAVTASIAACVTLSLLSSLDPAGASTSPPPISAAAVAADVQTLTGTAGIIAASHPSRTSSAATTAQSAGRTVAVPKDPSRDVTVATANGQHIGIGIPNGSHSARAATTASGTTVYTDPAAHSATAIQITTDGVRQLFRLNDATAPTDFTVPLTLPTGASLTTDGNGGYDIITTNPTGPATSIAHIATPWATDATGKSLPTTYTLNGNQLTQHVNTTGATFPVIADPHYTWGWITGTIYFNKTETGELAAGAIGASWIATFAEPWSALLQGYLAALGTEAALAVARGECVAFKSTLNFELYHGGYCR